MTQLEAIEIAKKYYKHVELRRTTKHKGNKELAKFHEGCMQMAIQIFEEFSHTHGFGSTNHALQCEKAILRTIRMIPTPDDIHQYYNCSNCQQNTIVARHKLINGFPMIQLVCTGCGILIETKDQ